MHPLIFRCLWLAATIASRGSGAKRAKEILSRTPMGAVWEVSRIVAMLLEAVVADDKPAFREAFAHLAGVEMKEGEFSLDAIDRASLVAETEYAMRTTILSTALLAAPELANRLEELAAMLRKNEKLKVPDKQTDGL